MAGNAEGALTAWLLDWELHDQAPLDWDDGAAPVLKAFLTLHTPYEGTVPEGVKPSERDITRALTRRGKPSWREDEVVQLFYRLGCAGYGYLNPHSVIEMLQRLARQRTRFSAFRLRRKR